MGSTQSRQVQAGLSSIIALGNLLCPCSHWALPLSWLGPETFNVLLEIPDALSYTGPSRSLSLYALVSVSPRDKGIAAPPLSSSQPQAVASEL